MTVTSRKTRAFVGNRLAACIMLIEGIDRLVAYHGTLAPDSGLPRAWPHSMGTAVDDLRATVLAAAQSEYPPALYPNI